MPSADSPHTRWAYLTVCSLGGLPAAVPHCLCSSPYGVWLVDGQDTVSNQRLGFYSSGFPSIPVTLQRQLPPRRRGPPGVSSDCFQRTIVRYTGFDLMTDRGLYPVLRTRP
jgi:hypothetical protein